MQFGFFDIDDKYKRLTELGDPLVQIDKLIDFTMFEEIFFKAFPKKDKPSKSNPKNAGRKPIAPFHYYQDNLSEAFVQSLE